jgi:hypothetical protein
MAIPLELVETIRESKIKLDNNEFGALTLPSRTKIKIAMGKIIKDHEYNPSGLGYRRRATLAVLCAFCALLWILIQPSF